jgi:chemosensory pili system protein ChpA (sensor histidine kinase/response regulator)
VSKTILIADDNLVMRNLIKHYLKSYNFELLEAKDGIETLSTIKKQHIDILFLDINMPNIDGFNVAKYIENIKKHPIIISISSDLTQSNMHIMEELGVKYFLPKPLNPSKFKAIMAKILESQTQESQETKEES